MGKLILSPEQTIAFDCLTEPEHSEITRVIYGGAAGSGKSFLISIWLDHMCRKYPGTRYYLARETLKDIKESVLLTFLSICKTTGSQIHYSEQKSLLRYPNDSEIYLKEVFLFPSDPNFNSLGSREYTAGAIEEGVSVTKKATEILISRTRYMHKEYNLSPKQLITCNPGDGWIKDEIVLPSLEGHKLAHSIFISANLASNPDTEFSARYHKTLEDNLSAYDRERLLNGNWNAKPKSGSEFLKEFNQDKHVRRNLSDLYNPHEVLHLTFDENLHPHITCQVWQIQKQSDSIRYARHLWDICLKPPRNRRKEVCKEIVKKFGGIHMGGMFVYGDATSLKEETDKEPGENFFTDIMEGLKVFNPRLKVPRKNPPVASKGSFMNLILEKNYRNICIEVDMNCKVSINDYAYAVEDEDGTILKKRVTDPNTKISYEQHGHSIDAASYFLCEAFLSDFNYYLSGGNKPQYDVGTDRSYKFER